MYDFILFENFHQAFNHYKDICIIAEYLKESGFRVAIADVFQEAEKCKVDGIEHIKLESRRNMKYSFSKSSNRHIAFIINTWRKIWIDRYLYQVVRELEPKAHNFYVGSYHCGMGFKWIKYLSKSKNVFFWGLRSSRLMEFKLRPFSPVGINGLILWNCVKTNNKIKFFISDKLIKKEFLELGINDTRLIIRPERYICELPSPKLTHDITTFLSIGSLREEKRIEIILNAFTKISSNSIKYIIAGKASQKYEQVIKKNMKPLNFVERKNYRIPDVEFDSLFEASDFLILCDKQQKSAITNGTMNEALLHGMPIIAPNYDPYRYYINKYGIGILYEPDDEFSLVSAIMKAKELKADHFRESILDYCRHYLLPTVSMCLKKELQTKLQG